MQVNVDKCELQKVIANIFAEIFHMITVIGKYIFLLQNSNEYLQ